MNTPGALRARKFAAGMVGALLAGLISAVAAPVQDHISAANIDVVQNDIGNNTASVTVTTALSINDFRIQTGSSRDECVAGRCLECAFDGALWNQSGRLHRIKCFRPALAVLSRGLAVTTMNICE